MERHPTLQREESVEKHRLQPASAAKRLPTQLLAARALETHEKNGPSDEEKRTRSFELGRGEASFASEWGCGGLEVVNVMKLRGPKFESDEGRKNDYRKEKQ